MRAALVVLAALLLAGCARDAGEDGDPIFTPGNEPTPPPELPPVVFGGVVIDGGGGATPEGLLVEVDLAQVRPCAKPGVGWTTWRIPVADGAFGPYEVPRPRSDDVAFFLRVGAPGYVTNMTFIGPQQARVGTHNLTIQLHAVARVGGVAEPGSVVALDAPGFPRLTVADANGTWRFDDARPVPAWLVIGGPSPFVTTVEPPAEDVRGNGTRLAGWNVEGVLKSQTGAGVAGDVVAFHGTRLVGAARASDTGVFALGIPGEPGQYRLEARTADGRLGATRVLDVAGPPALRETLLLRALC